MNFATKIEIILSWEQPPPPNSKIENDKNSIKSVFASPMPTDLISIRSIYSATMLGAGTHQTNDDEKKQISLAKQIQTQEAKKCIIQ